jgi:hypothetical protein
MPSSETVHASPGNDSDTENADLADALLPSAGGCSLGVAVVVVVVAAAIVAVAIVAVAVIVVIVVVGAVVGSGRGVVVVDGATVVGARVSAQTVKLARDTDESENHRISLPIATETPLGPLLPVYQLSSTIK